MEEEKHLLVSKRLHNLNPYEKTLVEAPEWLCEKPLFLSMFFYESMRKRSSLRVLHINGENTNFFHFRFRAIFHPKSIGVNIGTFWPIGTGSLTRSEKLFSHFSIIPYPLKIVLSLKYGRKKTFTTVEKTSQPQHLRKDPRGGTRMTMWKTFVSFDVFRRICKETLKFKCLTHING